MSKAEAQRGDAEGRLEKVPQDAEVKDREGNGERWQALRTGSGM